MLEDDGRVRINRANARELKEQESTKWGNANRGEAVLMATITLQDMQRDPLGYLHRVEAGETLVILRDDRAVAEIKPVARPNAARRPRGLQHTRSGLL